jgi:hypothetical protein
MEHSLNKKLRTGLLLAGLGLASSAAMSQSFPDFSVTETVVPGTIPVPTFTADKITGNYVEVITFSGSTFQASLLWQAGQFVANNGSTPVGSQLGSVSANQYGLYALYQANGTVSSNGTISSFNFTSGGSLNVFLDPNSNTGFNQPSNGSSPWTTSNSGDDLLIATGVPVSGQGTLDPTLSTCTTSSSTAGINCGSFGASSTWNATSPIGTSFLSSPTPFYSISFQSGQLNNFTPVATQVINGSLDVIFGGQLPVPEPSTTALLGLGMFAVAFASRKARR